MRRGSTIFTIRYNSFQIIFLNVSCIKLQLNKHIEVSHSFSDSLKTLIVIWPQPGISVHNQPTNTIILKVVILLLPISCSSFGRTRRYFIYSAFYSLHYLLGSLAIYHVMYILMELYLWAMFNSWCFITEFKISMYSQKIEDKNDKIPGKQVVRCKVTFRTLCQIFLRISSRQYHHLSLSVILFQGRTWKVLIIQNNIINENSYKCAQ